MATYQEAAKSFGDDNFVFVAYDDPGLFTPAGHGPRRRAGRGGRARADRRACSGSSRSTRCPCSGRSTTRCSRSTACRRSLRNVALSAREAGGQEHRPEDQRDDRRRRRPRGRRRPGGPGRAQGAADAATRCSAGTVIDGPATTTAVVVRLKKTAEHDVKATVAALRDRGRRVRGAAQAGPARGGRAAGPAGRRLHQHRARRPPAGDRRACS